MSPNFIRKVSKKLSLRLTTTCTALVFYQRFYARQSEQDHLPYVVATACVFLASKVEENCMTIAEVIDAAHSVRTNEPSRKLSDDDPEAYNKMQQHPHKYADKFVKTVSTGSSREQGLELMQATFNVLNDALTTNIPLKHHPRLIAAAAVSFAVRLLEQRAMAQMAMPRYVDTMDKFEKTGKLFDYPLNDIRQVECEFMQLYVAAIDESSAGKASIIGSTNGPTQ